MSADRSSVGSSGDHQQSLKHLGAREIVPAILCLALVCAVYSSSFHTWFDAWMKDGGYYSHGVLIPVIFAGLVWLKRKRLSGVRISPDPLGYLLIAPGLLITLILTWAGGTSAQGFTFPITLSGMVLVLFGRAMLAEMAFPLGYLYFMITLPDFILTMLSFRLQMLSTVGATWALRAMQFDVYRDGAMICLPNVDVQVAEACSGFKLLISLFALTVLYVYLMEAKLSIKALLVMLMLPIGVVLNSLRIAMVAMVGEFMGEDSMQAFHDTYAGIIMIAMALVTLCLTARRLRCDKFNSTLTF